METATTEAAGALERVFSLLNGPTGVSRALAERRIVVGRWACSKWLKAGRLPRTEYTGETNYAAALSEAVGGEVTVEQLLEAGRKPQELPA